jgi:hypothetical protein
MFRLNGGGDDEPGPVVVTRNGSGCRAEQRIQGPSLRLEASRRAQVVGLGKQRTRGGKGASHQCGIARAYGLHGDSGRSCAVGAADRTRWVPDSSAAIPCGSCGSGHKRPWPCHRQRAQRELWRDQVARRYEVCVGVVPSPRTDRSLDAGVGLSGGSVSLRAAKRRVWRVPRSETWCFESDRSPMLRPWCSWGASTYGSGLRACGAERCVSPGCGGVRRQGVVGNAPGGRLASATWRTPVRRSPRIAGGGLVFRGVAPALSFSMALS